MHHIRGDVCYHFPKHLLKEGVGDSSEPMMGLIKILILLFTGFGMCMVKQEVPLKK